MGKTSIKQPKSIKSAVLKSVKLNVVKLNAIRTGYVHDIKRTFKPVTQPKTLQRLSQHLKPYPPSKRSLLLVVFLCLSVPAHASISTNIFDPLLKVLIPSYKSDENNHDEGNDDEGNTEHNAESIDTAGIDTSGSDTSGIDSSSTTDNSSAANNNSTPTNQRTTAAHVQPPVTPSSKTSSLQTSSNQHSTLITTSPNTTRLFSNVDNSLNEDEDTGLLEDGFLEDDLVTPILPYNTTFIDGERELSPFNSKMFMESPRQSEPANLYELLEAEFDIDRGNPQRGLAIYKQQAFRKDATAVFERALELSLIYEDTNDSLIFASAWQQQNPDHVPAWFYVAHLSLKAQQYDLAAATLARILRYDPRADLSEMLIGIYPNKESDQRELLAALQPLDSTQNASLSVLKAGLLLKFKEPQAALLHINQALAQQPNNVPFITLKADILRQLNTAEDVINYIEQSRKRLPASKSLYLYEIRYYLEQNLSQKAWQLLLQAHQRFDNDFEITLLAALVGLDIEEYKQAERLLNELVKNPYYIDQGYYYLGISAERQQNFKDAKTYFAAVMQEDLVLNAREKVVAFELMDNNIDAAIATLVELRNRFEIYAPDSYILQADILRQQGATDEAKALLTKASQSYPNDENLLFARAQLLDDKEDFVIKRTLLNHLMALAPNNPAYQLSFAQLLLANDPNSQQGIALATTVKNIAFDSPNFDNDLHIEALNLLASSALANQQYQKVIDYLQIPYQVLPTLRSGILLLRANQGLGDQQEVALLLADLQRRFALGQDNINDLIQEY